MQSLATGDGDALIPACTQQSHPRNPTSGVHRQETTHRIQLMIPEGSLCWSITMDQHRAGAPHTDHGRLGVSQGCTSRRVMCPEPGKCTPVGMGSIWDPRGLVHGIPPGMGRALSRTRSLWEGEYQGRDQGRPGEVGTCWSSVRPRVGAPGWGAPCAAPSTAPAHRVLGFLLHPDPAAPGPPWCWFWTSAPGSVPPTAASARGG